MRLPLFVLKEANDQTMISPNSQHKSRYIFKLLNQDFKGRNLVQLSVMLPAKGLSCSLSALSSKSVQYLLLNPFFQQCALLSNLWYLHISTVSTTESSPRSLWRSSVHFHSWTRVEIRFWGCSKNKGNTKIRIIMQKQTAVTFPHISRFLNSNWLK